MFPSAWYDKYMDAPWQDEIDTAEKEAANVVQSQLNEVSILCELCHFWNRRAYVQDNELRFKDRLMPIFHQLESRNDTLHDAAMRGCGANADLALDLNHSYDARCEAIERAHKNAIVAYREARSKVIKEARRHKRDQLLRSLHLKK